MNKICTDLEQSKWLQNLGIDVNTADMYWDYDIQKHEDYPMVMDEQFDDTCIPAWSLAALLGVLPKGTNISTPKPIDELSYCCWNQYDEIYAVNPIDACYEMIIRLNELKLL